MQSSHDLIGDHMANRRPQRVGLYDRIWTDTLAGWVAAQGYPVDATGTPVDPHEHFGFDLCQVGGGFDALPIRGYTETVEETEEWIATRNGAGAVLKRWKHKSGTPEHVDFRMTTRDVWESDYRSYLLDIDPERIDVSGARERLARARASGKWAFYQHLFIWENMRQSMGDICLYESLLLDPDWIHDYNRVYTDFFIRHFRYLIEEAGRPDGIRICEDLGYKGGLFCSPAVLQELIFPYYRELIEFCHSYDLPVIFHTCGGIAEALPCLVELGIDALDPMEIKAGCDPLAFAEQYGDRVVFRGGLDVRILESGDRRRIREEVVRLVEGMKSRGARYILSSDHSVSTGVRYADFLYAHQVYREHMMY